MVSNLRTIFLLILFMSSAYASEHKCNGYTDLLKSKLESNKLLNALTSKFGEGLDYCLIKNVENYTKMDDPSDCFKYLEYTVGHYSYILFTEKNKIEFESNKDPSPNPEMKIYSTFLKLMKTSSISENESGSEYSKEEEIKNENSKISSKSKFSVQKLKNVSFSNTWDFANIITTGIKKEEINKNEQ